MTRTHVFLLPILLAGACSVGEVDIGGGGGDSGSGSGTDDKNLCVDRGTPATAYSHVSEPTGPRSGMGCVAVGCHLTGNTGSGATPFAFAGTVYKDVAGTTPNPGVSIRIFPGAGNKSLVAAVSDSAGNFIIRGDYQAYPYVTDATACGADAAAMGIRPMISPIARSDANCNAGGTCHASPGGQTPIYVLD